MTEPATVLYLDMWVGERIQETKLAGIRSCEPTLSSVQVDFERAGYLAARALDERLRRRVAPQVETFGALLTVRRESTRGYGRRAPKILEAIAYIRAHACDGLTADAVVTQIGGSRRLAELRFREAAGHSIHDEIESVPTSGDRLRGVIKLEVRGRGGVWRLTFRSPPPP